MNKRKGPLRKKGPQILRGFLFFMVGTRGFEPPGLSKIAINSIGSMTTF
jgi:hypothetical protein